jgi:methionyl-tRNA formyltransferase
MTINRVLFLGSKPLGAAFLAALHRIEPSALIGAITIDDRQDVRTAFDEISAFCNTHGIPFFVATNRTHAETLIRELNPELCMVSGWYWLIGSTVLNSVRHGFIGTHFSLLPKYRGGSPLVWALINGESEVGVSFFSFVEGVDAGRIWAQKLVPVGPDDYVGDILARLEAATLATLDTGYRGILNGEVQPVEQDHSGATYCAMRFPGDGEIYWRSPAADVYNFIRAQSHPYPGAFTWLEGTRLTIWRARRDNAIHYGTPGQVALVTSDGVHVVCGDHHVVILETVERNGIAGDARTVLKSVSIRLPSMAGGKV